MHGLQHKVQVAADVLEQSLFIREDELQNRVEIATRLQEEWSTKSPLIQHTTPN